MRQCDAADDNNRNNAESFKSESSKEFKFKDDNEEKNKYHLTLKSNLNCMNRAKEKFNQVMSLSDRTPCVICAVTTLQNNQSPFQECNLSRISWLIDKNN